MLTAACPNDMIGIAPKGIIRHVLLVETPFEELPELDYVLQVVLETFLGLPYSRHPTGAPNIRFCLEGRILEIASPFFLALARSGPVAVPLPRQPLEIWDAGQLRDGILLTSAKVPVLFGKPRVTASEDRIRVDFDLLGSIFFMLSRLEEVSTETRDIHERFPATASLGFQAGFLERPLVDEYVEILWACLTTLWPGLRRRPRAFRIQVSCDVDHPYSPARNSVRFLARHVARDALKYGNPRLAAQGIANFAYGLFGREDYSQDPFFPAVDWIMDVNEAAATSPVTFFFKAGQSSFKFDRRYSLEEPVIERLLARIHDRGHEIGLHPSYATFRDADLLRQEAHRLRQAMARMGIKQNVLGGRQHYLRWETPTTARAYEAAELSYDSTLSFADRAGFRCGTCHEFPFFDVQARRSLQLVERPLVVMEDTVISYMRLGHSDSALDSMQRLKETCRRFDGTFTLLWHNSNLTTAQDKQFYNTLLG